MSWIKSAVAIVAAWFSFGSPRGSSVSWTMLDVSRPLWPADAHLLQMPDRRNFLIDVGNEGPEIVSALRQRGVDVVHGILISHAHKDHYGGLRSLLKSNFKLVRVWMNVPARSTCDREIPWGCDYQHVQETVRLLKEQGVEVVPATAGMILYSSPGVEMQVVHLFDGVETPVGPTDVNDMSAVLRLSVGKAKVLFTGDLNASIGMYLSQSAAGSIAADILKVPHHGTESLVPNEFFDRVSPRVALVPSPADLWMTPRSARARTYFEQKKIPTYVNGVHGDVQVELDQNTYQITTQR